MCTFGSRAQNERSTCLKPLVSRKPEPMCTWQTKLRIYVTKQYCLLQTKQDLVFLILLAEALLSMTSSPQNYPWSPCRSFSSFIQHLHLVTRPVLETEFHTFAVSHGTSSWDCFIHLHRVTGPVLVIRFFIISIKSINYFKWIFSSIYSRNLTILSESWFHRPINSSYSIILFFCLNRSSL